MSHFLDKEKRSWSISLNVGLIDTIKKQTGIDLYDLFHHERGAGLVSRLEDPASLCGLVYAAVQPGIPEAEFAKLFDGDTVEAARVAIQEAIMDFYPSRRPLLAKVTQKRKEVEAMAMQKAMALIDDPKTNQMIEGILTSAVTFSNSPGTSESTPNIELSAS